MAPRKGKAAAGVGERASRVVSQATDVIEQAAGVLESEVAGGIADAQRLQRTLVDTKRMDPAAFDDVVTRVRTDGHGLIDMLSERLSTDGTDTRVDLVRRYTTDAHDVLDTLLNLATMAPDLVNRLADNAEARLPETKPKAAGSPRKK
jgi:hypothetical protein